MILHNDSRQTSAKHRVCGRNFQPDFEKKVAFIVVYRFKIDRDVDFIHIFFATKLL